MLYEPLVLLQRLTSEDVIKFTQHNPTSARIINRPQNAHTFQNNEESNSESPEKDLSVINSLLSSENLQQLTCSSPTLQILTASFNSISQDSNEVQQETLPMKQKYPKKGRKSVDKLKFADKSRYLTADLFQKELVVVIDDSFKNVIIDMVNSKTKYSKTRNPTKSTVATNSNSNIPATSTRNPTIVNDHINESNMIMTTKSPLSTVTPVIEVTDKKTKEVTLNNKLHKTAEKPKKRTKYNKVKQNLAGLSLRTRTISSSKVPISLHQSTISSTNSVETNCSPPVVTGRRPRGRPRRQNNVANGVVLKQTISKHAEESKVSDLTLKATREESAAPACERLIQKQSYSCNGVHNDEQENNCKNVTVSTGKNSKNSTLLSQIDKKKQIITLNLTRKKKIIRKQSKNPEENIKKTVQFGRKRKQPNIGKFVVEKRSLISNSPKNTLVIKKTPTKKSPVPNRPNFLVDITESAYGFLSSGDNVEPYQQRFDLTSFTSTSFCYGRTYWPTNWEYSAAALTGHVQKKVTKETLRKIRLMSGAGNTTKFGNTISSSVKSDSLLKKCQASVIQRRGSASKFTASLASVEMPSLINQQFVPPVVVKRPPGRPPGKKNKLFQAVLKANSPRKSPRQHASTLAIMSNKIPNTDKLVTQKLDELDISIIECNKNSLDVDGPCVLTKAEPNYERGVYHQKHRRYKDKQHIIKRRRRCRSITPPPPKLCAQLPAPQRTSINITAVNQEVVKLRTKHVDVVRRRARDERLRTTLVWQQLRKVQEIAEQNRHNLIQEAKLTLDEGEEDNKFSSHAIILPSGSSNNQILSSLVDDNREPDNMCLQIMYEQTADIRFLCTNLSDSTVQKYHQQRDLVLADCLTNNLNNADTMSCNLGLDMVSASNKRKKKRPNMTGWPKEKRRKVISATTSMNIEEADNDSDLERSLIIKRRRAAKMQRLRRLRIKLEQQEQAKGRFKAQLQVTATTRRRPGRPPGQRNGASKNNKIATYRRTMSLSSNATTTSNTNSTSSVTIKENKTTVQRQQKQCVPVQNKAGSVVPVVETTVTPNTVVKRSCGRPKGSVGRRKRIKLEALQGHRQNQTSSSSEQHKENVIQQPISTGKLKCVISTRNNRMKLLSTSSSTSSATSTVSSRKKISTGSKTKKSAYNFSSSCLEPLSSSVAVIGKTTRTTAKRRKLQQQKHQQMATATVAWDVGRPKRYHSAHHSRTTNSVAVEDDCCFVGSQPFEQHCPGGGGGLGQKTVLENQQNHQKENTVHFDL